MKCDVWEKKNFFCTWEELIFPHKKLLFPLEFNSHFFWGGTLASSHINMNFILSLINLSHLVRENLVWPHNNLFYLTDQFCPRRDGFFFNFVIEIKIYFLHFFFFASFPSTYSILEAVRLFFNYSGEFLQSRDLSFVF